MLMYTNTMVIITKPSRLKLRKFYKLKDAKSGYKTDTHAEFAIGSYNGCINLSLGLDMVNSARGAENYRTVQIGTQYAYSLFSRILDNIRKYPNFKRITEDIYESEKVKGNTKKNKVLAGEFILERGETCYNFTVNYNGFTPVTFLMGCADAPVSSTVDGRSREELELSYAYTERYFGKVISYLEEIENMQDNKNKSVTDNISNSTYKPNDITTIVPKVGI